MRQGRKKSEWRVCFWVGYQCGEWGLNHAEHKGPFWRCFRNIPPKERVEHLSISSFPSLFPSLSPQLLSLTKGALTSNSWLPMRKLSSFHNFGESCEEEKQSLWFAGDGRVGHVWGTVHHSCAEILASKEEMEPKALPVACYHHANLFAQIHLHHLSFYDKSSRRVGSFVEWMGWAHWALSGFSCQRKQNLIMKLNIF